MERQAVAAGFYETGSKKFPKLQILTAEQILDNRRPQVPFEDRRREVAHRRGRRSCKTLVTKAHRNAGAPYLTRGSHRSVTTRETGWRIARERDQAPAQFGQRRRPDGGATD